MTEITKSTEAKKDEMQVEKEKLESVKRADAAVKTMHDFTSPEVLYKELINSVLKYHPSTDISMIEKAYKVASEAHEGQKRKSGEPYIIHPLCVAIILADLELDKETIVAGLLHDAVEDTWMTYEEVEKEFGSEVALLVDGVTKLGQLSYSADKVEVQAENLRKMFLAMAKDIRVILIKLADRLHNMRTLQYMRPEKQQEKARETMDIYAPIAMRLGISKIKVELDDLSLKYLKPDVYYDLVHKVALRKSEREQFVGAIVKEVKKHMDDANIKAQVDGRVKHFFSIYKKMVNQDKTIDQIYDLFAVRILVDTVKDCYAALGVIHEMYKPIPGRFKDYIAMLTMICMLKQVLSIQDISQLLKSLTEHTSKTELYDQFRISQAKVLEDICSRVNQTAEQGKDALTKLALELSIEANARRTAAERILSELAEEEAPKHNKKKEKAKMQD